MESEEQQDIVWSRFCALYLPATVERYINPPSITTSNPDDIAAFKLFSPCSEMLVQVQHNAYFAKYLRSQKPLAAAGKQLPRVLAERILELGQKWEPELLNPSPQINENYKSYLSSALQLLSTVCAVFIKIDNQETVVPKALKDRLIPLLKKWGQRYRGEFLAEVSGRVYALWTPSAGMRADAKRVRKRTLNWEECGLPGCEVKMNLKARSKCVK